MAETRPARAFRRSSGADIETEADRLVCLGVTRLRGRIEEQGANWIVMADPEGNEFCVCRDLT
jgi:predicted enzyme related to lactoylglutathione lyase